MAIVKNFWLVNQSKKLAGAVIYQAMGQTRSRELAASVSNPRTVSQMNQRVKWANLVNFYRINSSWMKFAYETKKTNQSEYNKFMSLNVSNSRIFLPKSLAAQGACVVDSYIMTQGSLASIEVTVGDGEWITNLFIGDTDIMRQNVTVGEVSQALLENNPAIREGDQLSFIRFSQLTSPSSGVPYVVVRKYEVIVKADDTRPFYEFMPREYIGVDSVTTGYAIAVNDSGNAGGFLLCLSRTVGGKTYVSTQSIIVANNDALIAQYSSSTALQEAIDSYGESEEPFLTSTTAEEDNQASVPTTLVTASIDDVEKPFGQLAQLANLAQDATIEAQLSAAPSSGSATAGVLTYYEGGVKKEKNLTSLALDGAIVSGALNMDADGINVTLGDIIFTIGGVEYRGVWTVPNSATIHGLE